MRAIDRRMFLKGVGVVGGTIVGFNALRPFAIGADGGVLQYGLAAADTRILDPMGGPNATDKAVLEHIYRGLVRPTPGEVNAERSVLFIDNETAARVLTMEDTIEAVEESYREYGLGRATATRATHSVPRPGGDELLPQEETGMNYETRSDALGHRFLDSSPFVSGCNSLEMF